MPWIKKIPDCVVKFQAGENRIELKTKVCTTHNAITKDQKLYPNTPLHYKYNLH